MKIKTITYSKLVNLGHYENCKIEASAELDKDDNVEDSYKALKQYVEDKIQIELNIVEQKRFKAQEELRMLRDSYIHDENLPF